MYFQLLYLQVLWIAEWGPDVEFTLKDKHMIMAREV